MPRVTQVTIPCEKTDQLLEEIKKLPELISLRVQRDISVHPPGDVISIETTNRSLHELMRLLRKYHYNDQENISFTTSEPLSIISSPLASPVKTDVSESTWEEMDLVIGKESNMSINGLLAMGISGILAAIGIATNALHIVIGAMVIAPGFEPLSRIALGVVSKSKSWQVGISHTLRGYSALLTGAAAATMILQVLGKSPLGGEASYLPEGVLITYWTSISMTSLIVSAAASVAGSLLVATNRSVLTGGVMIALALVPSAAITGMALVSGETGTALQAFVRWLIEAGFVTFFSTLVFLWKRLSVQRRDMFI